MDEIKAQISSIEQKLNSSTYRGIDDKHKKLNIQYETTLMAVSDLDSYFTALDRALQACHLVPIYLSLHILAAH